MNAIVMLGTYPSAVTAGAYAKKMRNLVYYTDAMALFTSAAQGWGDHAKVGSGSSRGLEFLYEGRLPDAGLRWDVAYTWSKTWNLVSLFPIMPSVKYTLEIN